MNRQFLKLQKAHNAYLDAIDAITSEIKTKVSFQFSIAYMPGDGFVIESDTDVAPLENCLELIKSKGVLSYQDFLSECI